jgi:hypothetical protein
VAVSDREYRYYAIVDENFSRENPFGLVRAWGTPPSTPDEETFAPQLLWKPDNIIERIRRGSLYWDFEEITEQEAEQVRKVLTKRFKKEMKESRRNIR